MAMSRARVLRILVLLACLFTPLLVHAQDRPITEWADKVSWVTAESNAGAAAVAAWRSEHRGCELARLGLSEFTGNGISMLAKRTYRSPRPCLGCAPDGMPSGHTMNSVIGAAHAWGGGWRGVVISSVLVAVTGWLRVEAGRHTWRQVAAGALLGIGSEAAGHLIRCPTNGS